MQNSLSSRKLYCKRVTCERFVARDWRFFKKIATDKTVQYYFSEYRTAKDLHEYFDNEIVGNQSSQSIMMVIREKESGDSIGFCNLYCLGNSIWMVEFALIERYRGKGYIEDVLKMVYCLDGSIFLKAMGSSEQEIKQLFFIVDRKNWASQHTIEKFASKNECTLFISEGESPLGFIDSSEENLYYFVEFD